MWKSLVVLSVSTLSLTLAGRTAVAQYGVHGEITVAATVNTVEGTDFMPGDLIAIYSDASVSVDSFWQTTNFRLNIKFYDGATMEEILSESNFKTIFPGTGDEFSEDAGYDVPNMAYSNSYRAVIQLSDYTDAMNEVVLDSDFRVFTTD